MVVAIEPADAAFLRRRLCPLVLWELLLLTVGMDESSPSHQPKDWIRRKKIYISIFSLAYLKFYYLMLIYLCDIMGE